MRVMKSGDAPMRVWGEFSLFFGLHTLLNGGQSSISWGIIFEFNRSLYDTRLRPVLSLHFLLENEVQF